MAYDGLHPSGEDVTKQSIKDSRLLLVHVQHNAKVIVSPFKLQTCIIPSSMKALVWQG